MSGGLLAFLVVLALVAAAVLLFRSMSKHLRKVPASFDRPEEPDERSRREPPDGAGGPGQSS